MDAFLSIFTDPGNRFLAWGFVAMVALEAGVMLLLARRFKGKEVFAEGGRFGVRECDAQRPDQVETASLALVFHLAAAISGLLAVVVSVYLLIAG